MSSVSTATTTTTATTTASTTSTQAKATGPTRSRTKSDVRSGLDLNLADFPQCSEEEIVRQFSLFNQYDLDHTGFISKENLLDVLTAMEVAGAGMAMVTAIIDEVAILCGHENDGKLTFRDFMKAIEYDHAAAQQNSLLDQEGAGEAAGAPSAAEVDEPSGSFREEEAELPPPAAEESRIEAPSSPIVPETRTRMSSLSVVNTIAAGRIKAFQQAVDEEQRTRAKIDAFRTKPRVLHSGPMVNSEEVHKETLKSKIAAFEVAAKCTGKVELKKTWRQAHGTHGNYLAGQRVVVDGAKAKPPPKKRLADLP